MKTALTVAALSAALLATGAGPASATSKYGYGHGRHYSSLAEARAYGHCLYPRQIRHKLSYEGWHGFDVQRLYRDYAIVCSYRHGKPYELKVDRCSGEVYRAKPLYADRGYGYGY